MSGEKMRSSPRGNEDIIIVGVDILPSYSPSSRHQPHYAVVFVKNENIIDSYEDASFSRLIRLIWEYRPKILAIDNVFELAENIDKLVHVTELLPPDLEIIQVTGWGPNAVNIKTLAKKYGINVYGKPSPLKTAYIAAIIALRGGGFKVKLLEDKTRIIISKGRTVSHGGMSYDRYKRSINVSILAATREVKRKLDEHGFDYDLTFKKGEGGLEKSIFTVYASREKLHGIIKPFRNRNVRLVIKPVYKNKIQFSRQTTKLRRGLILGIDPGIYTGIALIDLTGKPIYTYSSKNLDRGDIINIASNMGKIVAVATDVAHPPELVKKTASSLNADLYVPPHDISNDEKRMILNMLKEKFQFLEVDDTHERDALVAAYKAYLSIADKLRQAEAKIRKMDIGLDIDTIRIMIAKGKSIAEAIESEIERLINNHLFPTGREEEIKSHETRTVNEQHNELIKKLRNKINRLIAENKMLREKLREKDHIISELEIELKLQRESEETIIKKDRRINTLLNEINALRKRITALEQALNRLSDENTNLKTIISRIITGKYYAFPIYSCPDAIPMVLPKNNGEHLAIFVRNIQPLSTETAKRLKQERIAILANGDHGELIEKYRIPIIDVTNYERFEYDDKLFIDKSIVDEISEKWTYVEELDNEDEYRKVLKLVEEYKKERKKLFGENYDSFI